MDPVRTVDGKPPIQRPSNGHRPGAKGQGFKNVAAPADTGINVDLRPAFGGIDDFRQHLYGPHGHVQLPSAVGGDQNAFHAALHRHVGVFGRPDPFQYKG